MPRTSGGFRLLVIKPKMIGDTLLLAPALQALRASRPDVHLSVLVRSGTEGILEGTASIDQLWVTQPPDSDGAAARHSGASLVRQLRRERFDLVCELTGTDRGRYLALLTRARRRVLAPSDPRRRLERVWRLVGDLPDFPAWGRWHTVRRDWEVLRSALGLPDQPLTLTYPPTPPPRAWAADARPQVVVHPVTRWAAKAWPEERWHELMTWLVTRFRRVVISTGPSVDEVALAHRLAAPHDGVARCTEGHLPWAQLAGVLQESALFIGVDTAAMHLAAACRTPIVAVWGPSREQLWSPWGGQGALVLENAVVPIPDAMHRVCPAPELRSAAANAVATVIAAVETVLRAGRDPAPTLASTP